MKDNYVINKTKRNKDKAYSKFNMKLILTALIIITCFIPVILNGCGNDPDITYASTFSKAQGTITIGEDSAEISIDNIQAYIGDDIDYYSNVKVTNARDYPDLEIWVNASGVNIYEEGTYTAVYTIYNGKKTYTQSIKVKIVADSTASADASSTIAAKQDETKIIVKNEIVTDVAGDVATNSDGAAQTEVVTQIVYVNTNSNNSQQNQATTKVPTQIATTKPSSIITTTKATSGATNTAVTTHREMITSAGATVTYKNTNIGSASIELLSGAMVNIKCTNSRYIVSTRTDVSYITKNNMDYQVSKLIITFNTGEQQVLETVETRIK